MDMNNMQQPCHSLPRQYVRRRVTMAVLSILMFGQQAMAITSSNMAGPITGRQITTTGSPVLTGVGIAGTDLTVTVPGTADADGDQLSDWHYVWRVDGADVGSESSASSLTTIPPYMVKAGDAGKTIEVCLKAQADKGFPVATKTSNQVCSSPVTAQAVTVEIADPGVTSVDENTLFDVTLWATSNNPNADYEWTLSGADAAHFTITPGNPNLGAMLTMVAKDYEQPSDQNTDNVYDLVVTVKDLNSNTTTTHAIAVSVNNVDEVKNILEARVTNQAGTADIAASPLVGSTLYTKVQLVGEGSGSTGRGAEDVGESKRLTYQWQVSDNGSTGWTNISATGDSYTVTRDDQGRYFRVDVTAQ